MVNIVQSSLYGTTCKASQEHNKQDINKLQGTFFLGEASFLVAEPQPQPPLMSHEVLASWGIETQGILGARIT